MVFSESHCKFIFCCFMSHLSRYTINSSMARVIFLNACGILPLLARFRIPGSWHPALLKVLPVAWIESSLGASVHVWMETIFDLWGRGVGVPASMEASKQVTWTRILFPMNLRWGFSSWWSEHGRWLMKSLVDGEARWSQWGGTGNHSDPETLGRSEAGRPVSQGDALCCGAKAWASLGGSYLPLSPLSAPILLC